jgi:hypothetical protein
VNPSGNSLGLSIAKNIAKNMKGDLKVVSRLGQGSTFTFTLLAKLIVPKSERTPKKGTSKSQKKNKSNLQSVAKMISEVKGNHPSSSGLMIVEEEKEPDESFEQHSLLDVPDENSDDEFANRSNVKLIDPD